MLKPNLTQRLIMGMIAVSTCATPTLAATSSIPGSSRFVALSYLGSDASRAALCGHAASAAAAQTAVAGTSASGTAGQAAPTPGCVLPAVDPIPTAPATEILPPPTGPSLLGPLIAGLAGLVAVLVLVSVSDQDDGDLAPVSPS